MNRARESCVDRRQQEHVVYRLAQASVYALFDRTCPDLGRIVPRNEDDRNIGALHRGLQLRVDVEPGKGPVLPPRARHGGKLWAELTEDEHRRMPGDAEAMVSQGPIAARNREHLASSDRGVILVRQRIREAIEAVERGEDPPGVARGADEPVVSTTAGNLVLA